LIDKDILLSKADKVHRHVGRVKEKRPATLQEFVSAPDLQDIVLFNLQMAIQNCIDMASHVISDEGLGLPGSTNEMFYLLQETGLWVSEISWFMSTPNLTSKKSTRFPSTMSTTSSSS
jgi:uncharacterized protein YutE (UPF0331/DUF86 family)